MKKIIFLSLFTSALYAQTIYTGDGLLSNNRTVIMKSKNLTFSPSTPNSQVFINGTNGDVGIGTVNPIEKLQIAGNIMSNEGIFTNSLSNGVSFLDWNDRNIKCSVINGGFLRDVNDKGRTFRFFDFPISNLNAKPQVFFAIEDRGNFNRFRFIADQLGETQFYISNKNQEQLFSFYEDGNDNVSLILNKSNSKIGIGTSSFVDGIDNYSLSVNGAIRAHRVRVYNTWADFVFEKNYKLPTLFEVENHIKEKGHLIDIPSALQVEKEGIDLGEMNKLLLQKVEELTLYIIELNKKVELLSNKK